MFRGTEAFTLVVNTDLGGIQMYHCLVYSFVPTFASDDCQRRVDTLLFLSSICPAAWTTAPLCWCQNRDWALAAHSPRQSAHQRPQHFPKYMSPSDFQRQPCDSTNNLHSIQLPSDYLPFLYFLARHMKGPTPGMPRLTSSNEQALTSPDSKRSLYLGMNHSFSAKYACACVMIHIKDDLLYEHVSVTSVCGLWSKQ